MEIKKVDSEEIRKLRHVVLRKGSPFFTTKYKKDKDKETIHLAAIKNKKIITCATFYPEKTEIIKSKEGYRLRGMATDPEFRRKGYGKKILKKAVLMLKRRGCDVLWCNARLVAVEFYESQGFKKTGEKFNISNIGPHYYMYKKII